MNRPPVHSPERLLAADATDFERRLLRAAGEKGPSPAASARMARALGVTATMTLTAATGTAVAAEAAASKAAVAGASAVWPWVSAGVIGLVVAGAVVGTRMRHPTQPEVRAAVPTEIPPLPPPDLESPARVPEQPAVVVETPTSAPAVSHRTHAAFANRAIGDQIAFIDAAREALATGADRAALELLRRYQDKYPAGSFRPEATALKVEALVKLGRQAEAHSLAERFVAEHPGSLLATRVAALANLAP
jgi:hypothetical protein